MTSTGNDGAAHVAMTTGSQTPGERAAARKLVTSVIILFACGIIVGGANLWFTANQVNSAHQRTLAACAFWQDLAVVPVANATNGYPSELAISIVAHSREAFRGFGCKGKLPPPSPSFVRGARHYGIDPR